MSKHIDRNAAWEGSARGGARSAGRRRRTFWRAALASGIGAAGLVTAALPASVALAAPPSFPAAASEVQVPGSTLGLVLEGVTCLSGGDCTAVGASVGAPGASDRSLPVVAAQAAHGWAASTVPLPHEAGSGPAGGLASVSCVVRGACYAVGEYADASSILPLVESDAADGLWQPLAEPPLPSSSASSAPLDGVSCTPDGACLAVGSITTSSRTQAMAGFLTGSAARAGLQLVPAPAGAASGNPNAVLTSVSCVARSCVAVGYYTDAAGTTVPMAVSESNGRFGKAEELAYPPNGGGDLFAVSCAAAGACTAVGYALTAAGGRKEPLYLVDAGGTWQGAQSLPLPSTAGRDAAGTLEGISCAASGTCVIVGSYGTDKQQLAMYAEEDGGSWQRPIELATPDSSSSSAAQLDAVSCKHGGQYCAAAGSVLASPSASPIAVAITSSGTPFTPGLVPTPMTLTAVPGFDPQQSTLDAAQVFQNAPSPDALGAGDPLTMTATLDTPPGTGSPYQAVIDFDLLGAPSRPRGAVAVPGGYEACTAISKVKTADSITATCTANAPAGGSNGIVAVAVYPGSLLYHSSYAVAPVNDMGFTSKDVDPGVALVGVSCPTTSFCAAADGAGSVVFYRAGTGWQHPEPVDPHGAVSISCASADLCAIGDAHGGVAMYDGSGWSYDASADPGYALVAISCPDVDYCAAAGNGYSSSTGDYGDIVQWSGGAWTTAVNDSAAPPAPEGAEGMLGLSCAGSGSSVTCVAGDFSANAFYGGPNGWGQAVPLSSVPINSGYTYAGATGDVSTPIYPISCFAAGDYGCMAMEGAVSGLALGETNGGGLGWVPLAQPIDGDTGILADGAVAGSLSCADAVFCVNVDAYGRVQTWDGAGWAAPGSTALPQIDPSGALSDQYSTGVSCPSATFCVAVDGYDGNVWVGQG